MPAQVYLALLLEDGREGVAANAPAALSWLQLAAEKNYAAAQYHLGRFYEQGIGAEKNMELAQTWYSRAAQAGDDQAAHAMERLALADR